MWTNRNQPDNLTTDIISYINYIVVRQTEHKQKQANWGEMNESREGNQ